MKKTKKRKTTKKTLIFFLVIAVLAVSFAVFFDFQKALADTGGWAKGIWNDTVGYLAGTEQASGIPAIGWLSSNSETSSCGGATSAKYGLTLAGSGADRPISGSAWFGIGSRPDTGAACGDNDLPSLGWLDFAAGSPSFCSGDACHSAILHPQGGGIAGYLDGWAKVRALGENGWVKLKGSNYSVMSDASGVLSGYGWNSGVENWDYRDPALGGNSGLGWINLTGLKLKNCNLACGTATHCPGQKLSCQSNYCTGDGSPSCSMTGDAAWSCSSSGCGEISCAAKQENPEPGECGRLNGASSCDPNVKYTEGDYCKAGAYTLKNSSVLLTTWTCGKDVCGEHVTVECSAKARCGWIEATP